MELTEHQTIFNTNIQKVNTVNTDSKSNFGLNRYGTTRLTEDFKKGIKPHHRKQTFWRFYAVRVFAAQIKTHYAA